MADIKTYVIPRHLYRYRSLAKFEREMDAIESGYLHCTTYKEMNDPMEGFYSSSKLLKARPDLDIVRDKILSSKTNIGICAFSEVFDHELMWAHYANQFKGICVAYDFYNLRKRLSDDVNFSRVFYNEEAPRVSNSKRPLDYDKTAKKILSYKNHRWLYEREWRMFANIGKADYHPQCVVRVYLGWRVQPSQQQEILRRLKQLKIPCKLQKLDGYEMSFQKESH